MTFPVLIEKILATFDFARIICQNLHHEIKKNRNRIRDIRDIKYPRHLNFCIFATFNTRDFSNCFSRDIQYPRLLVPKSRDLDRDFRDIKYH